MNLPQIPEREKQLPWVKPLLELLQGQAQLIQRQAEEIALLKAKIEELQDEIARLRKMPKKPQLRAEKKLPRGKHKGSPPPSERSKRSGLKPKVEEVILKVENVPPGSISKGYATYSIQELSIEAKEVIYKLQIYQTPDGSLLKASLPPGVEGSHFGPGLRAAVHGFYAAGMTQPAIFEFLVAMGIDISEGQVHRLLVNEAEAYGIQSEEILSAGLQEAPYMRVDDTGAKHGIKNGYCTHIGGDYFAYYKSTSSKSRLNFLKILAQGKEGYCVNDACIWHLFSRGVHDGILNAFEEHKGKIYKSEKKLDRLLNQMGIREKKLRTTCLEAGFVGYIAETQLKPGQVLLSDGAAQFAVFNHATCWVHMERPLRKLPASTSEVEAEIAEVRQEIWSLYRQVEEASLSQEGKEAAIQAYERLINKKVISPGVQKVLDSFRKHREELLKPLDHPGLPLHNNGSELDIRRIVKLRKVSGATKSAEGRLFRDALMTLKQTCYRLGQSFWEYLQSWFLGKRTDLASMVRAQYRAALPLFRPP